jgi:HEAT repeat protein
MRDRRVVPLMLPLSLVVGLPGLLAAAPPPSAAEALIPAVEDTSRPIAVTKKAVQALGELGDPRAVPVLVKLLYQERQGRTLAAEAAFALFQIGRPSADALLRVVRRKDPELLAWANANHLPETWLLGQSMEVLGDLGDLRAQAPLLDLLSYENSNQPLALVVRRHAASALGRLKSRSAVAPVANLVSVPNPQARHEFVRALMLIGGRKALPALARAASEGEWDVRTIAIDGFTMLGDEREKPAFQKILQREEGIIMSDCRAHPNIQGCDNQTALLDRMLSGIRAHGSRLAAAGRCKENLACWTERLKDADPEVRQRAVLELGRRASARQLDPLVAALGDPDASVQFAAVQCLEWLLATDAAARTQGRRHIEALEARLAKGEGTVAGARFDAPLRRLIFRLRSPGAHHEPVNDG